MLRNHLIFLTIFSGYFFFFARLNPDSPIDSVYEILTTNAGFNELESVNTSLTLKQDETLDPELYDQMLGNYVTADNQIITIGRSQTRLFAYFENDHKYRGLNKINATNWMTFGIL